MSQFPWIAYDAPDACDRIRQEFEGYGFKVIGNITARRGFAGKMELKAGTVTITRTEVHMEVHNLPLAIARRWCRKLSPGTRRRIKLSKKPDDHAFYPVESGYLEQCCVWLGEEWVLRPYVALMRTDDPEVFRLLAEMLRKEAKK